MTTNDASPLKKLLWTLFAWLIVIFGSWTEGEGSTSVAGEENAGDDCDGLGGTNSAVDDDGVTACSCVNQCDNSELITITINRFTI